MSFITATGGINPPYTAGGVAYGTGSGTSVSTAGTAGQVLTSAGAGAPTWSAAASGSFTLISTLTASATNALSWTGLSGSYTYLIIFNGIGSGGFADNFQVRAGSGGSLTTSGYFGAGMSYTSTAVTPYQAMSNASGVFVAGPASSTAPSGYMYIIQTPTSFDINFLGSSTDINGQNWFVQCYKTFTGTITNLQVFEPNRNFTTGSASLYKLTT